MGGPEGKRVTGAQKLKVNTEIRTEGVTVGFRMSRSFKGGDDLGGWARRTHTHEGYKQAFPSQDLWERGT